MFYCSSGSRQHIFVLIFDCLRFRAYWQSSEGYITVVLEHAPHRSAAQGQFSIMVRAYTRLLLAFTLLCSASAFEWKTCADTGKADVTHVSLSPDPPQAGDTIKFSIDAESSTWMCAYACCCCDWTELYR